MAEVAFWFALLGLLPTASKALSADKETTSTNQQKMKRNSLVSEKPPISIFGAERIIDIPNDVFPTKEELGELEKGMELCQHEWFESCIDGARLHFRKWLPPGKPKAIVIWMHGISAHGGRAIVLDDGKRKLGIPLQCENWLKEGCAFYAFDHYGHGYSEGLRWHVPNFENNRDDLVAFTKMVAREHEENTPLFVTGESYGGNLALHVAKYFQETPSEAPKGFDSMILVAPAIIPPELPPKPVVSFLTLLSKYYPTWIPFFMPNPVSPDRIWRDKRVLAKFTDKRMEEMCIEGGGKPYRLATAVSLLEALDKVQKEIIPGLKVPFCVVHGEKDAAVPISGTEFLLENSSTPEEDRAVKRLPDAYHDLMTDPVAEDAMQFMVDFVKKRIAAKK